MPDATYSSSHTTTDDALDICLERLLLHGARLLTVRLEIICHTTGDIIAQQWLSDVQLETGDQPRHWLDRDTLHTLVLEARDNIHQQMTAWQSFYRAA
ncbi:fatty acid/phospholipid synthesis protein [Salmonella enterica]|nr:fatty acid/phospholipid synthesis protein [Salmonella enterica]EGY9844731.1 fatty acid/phospholipid synthesis protein [Salmonella enterica]